MGSKNALKNNKQVEVAFFLGGQKREPPWLATEFLGNLHRRQPMVQILLAGGLHRRQPKVDRIIITKAFAFFG